MSTVEQQVKKIVAEQLGVEEEEVTNDASFVDDLGADSEERVQRAHRILVDHRHLAAGLPHVAGDYMGEHWLATFAVLALEAGQGSPL